MVFIVLAGVILQALTIVIALLDQLRKKKDKH
jgi:hypothetical protein